MTARSLALGLALLIPLTSPAVAESPEIVGASATPESGRWTISVTLRHPDTGWDHYASGWEVLAPDGSRIGFRELTHPHVEEQPFTRTLTGVEVADGADHILIRPRCNRDGWSGMPIRLDLPR